MASQSVNNGVTLTSFKTKPSVQESNVDPVTSRNESKAAKPGTISRCGTPLPLARCNFLSFCTVQWLSPLVYEIGRSVKESVEENVLWSCAQEDGCQQNGERLKEIWQRELHTKGRRHASFFKCCAKFLQPYHWRACAAAVIFALNLAALTILVFRNLVRYLQYGGQGPYYGYLLAGCIFIVSCIHISLYGYSFSIGQLYGTRLKGAGLYLVYEKLLRTNSIGKSNVGELVNIFSTDAMRLYMAVFRLHMVPLFFTILVFGITASWFLIGWWTLVAAFIFTVMLLVQMIMTKISTGLQKKKLIHTDSRIQKMKEVITSIRLIKMWDWEKPFLTEIFDERRKETRKSERLTFLTCVGVSQIFQAPSIATAVTLTLYIHFGYPITTEVAFTVATLIATVRYSIMALPIYGRILGDVLVSCRRIQELLLRPEMKEEVDIVTDNQLAVQLINASFRWPVDLTDTDLKSSEMTDVNTYSNHLADEDVITNGVDIKSKQNGIPNASSSPNNNCALRNISFEVRKGSLVGVCGKVGSGKSALVSALLKQLRKTQGISAVNGSVAICPQEAWIFSDTVRGNILFGYPMDKERYERVLDLTCLREDLVSLPSADLSEVGERGITLSGGQRQRVSLARALYSDRDIYILDDPLSALDVTVGQQVFTRCIKEGLKDKTVILITHQLQYLQDCDQVMFLKEGMILESGTHAELMSQGREYASLIKSFYEKTNTEKGRSKRKTAKVTEKKEREKNEPDPDAGRLIELESTELGQVSWATYLVYLRSLGGPAMFIFLVFTFLLAEALSWGCNWWLTAWLQQIDSVQDFTNATISENATQSSNSTYVTDSQITRIKRALIGVTSLEFDIDKSMFVTVYGLGAVAFILANCLSCWALAKATIKSSRVIHKHAVKKVMDTSVSFFDKTPFGRIMNRFSADIDIVDTYLAMDVGLILIIGSRILLGFVSVAAIFPLMMAVFIPVFIPIYIFGKLGRASIRQMKRIDHVSRSILVDHVSNTIQGLDSVRIYEKEVMFSERMIDLTDRNAVRFMIYRSSADWLMLRTDMSAAFVSMLTAIFVVLFRDAVPAQLGGLALSVIIQCVTTVGPLVQHLSQVEGWFTSVERLNEYMTNLKPEGSQKDVNVSADNEWPRHGQVTFNDVCMRYESSNNLVLKNVSFCVTAGQNIGIVGRTGAGKSSLGAALFRLVELSSGSILIDGVDISQLNLHQLRSRLSVIPQEPVLFTGSLRRNVDPFNTTTDEDIWTALEKSQLKEKVMNLTGRLEHYVGNNGGNFSVGERQLLCMARALLRNTKVLLLDEATANVDTETDSKIQQMVREYFTERTVFIIAHRLNTVQHCDKILVMNDGKAQEFDSPENLMKQPNSLYRSMLNTD